MLQIKPIVRDSTHNRNISGVQTQQAANHARVVLPAPVSGSGPGASMNTRKIAKQETSDVVARRMVGAALEIEIPVKTNRREGFWKGGW